MAGRWRIGSFCIAKRHPGKQDNCEKWLFPGRELSFSSDSTRKLAVSRAISAFSLISFVASRLPSSTVVETPSPPRSCDIRVVGGNVP